MPTSRVIKGSDGAHGGRGNTKSSLLIWQPSELVRPAWVDGQRRLRLGDILATRNRTHINIAGLFGAALAALIIAGGSPSHAQTFGCFSGQSELFPVSVPAKGGTLTLSDVVIRGGKYGDVQFWLTWNTNLQYGNLQVTTTEGSTSPSSVNGKGVFDVYSGAISTAPPYTFALLNVTITDTDPQTALNGYISCFGNGSLNYIREQYLQRTMQIGTGSVTTDYYPTEGASVALSGDGNTAIVGGPGDNGSKGATWVFTQSGGVWSQQGSKLVGTGGVGTFVDQGSSVALSSDGNTAIVGGPIDNSGVGAVWVFTQSGGVWTQQGSKLVPSNETGNGSFGNSVALSADGNTAIVGGPLDNAGVGAAWVFTRSGGVWSQQGSKLLANDESGEGEHGWSVALSADGTTALVGGRNDNGNVGAVRVFTQSGGVWSQQGPKLVGTGSVGTPVYQGHSVALSADGNTAIEGGYGDNNSVGAAWVFTRSNGVWSQQGSKLVGSAAFGPSEQGLSVALSGDGSTAMVGGPGDDGGNPGAAWVFSQSGGVWSQQGPKFFGTGYVAPSNNIIEEGASVALSADGTTALVGGPGANADVGAIWVFSPGDLAASTHDFNGDGYSDIVWSDMSGDAAIWLMNGSSISSAAIAGTAPGWSLVGQRDYDGDGKADLLSSV